jgi:hypothetical protein
MAGVALRRAGLQGAAGWEDAPLRPCLRGFHLAAIAQAACVGSPCRCRRTSCLRGFHLAAIAQAACVGSPCRCHCTSCLRGFTLPLPSHKLPAWFPPCCHRTSCLRGFHLAAIAQAACVGSPCRCRRTSCLRGFTLPLPSRGHEPTHVARPPAPPHTTHNATRAPPPPRAGVVDSAGLELLDFSVRGEPEAVWQRPDVHARAPGLCLRSSASSRGGYSVIASCSSRTDVK